MSPHRTNRECEAERVKKWRMGRRKSRQNLRTLAQRTTEASRQGQKEGAKAHRSSVLFPVFAPQMARHAVKNPFTNVCMCVRLCLLRDIRPSQEGKLQGRGIDWKDQHSFLLGLRKARNLWTNEIPPPVGQLCYHKQRNGLFFCDFSIWVFFSFHDRCCCCCSCL